MYRNTKPSRNINVRNFSQILLWPVLLKESPALLRIQNYVELFEKVGWSESPLLQPVDATGMPFVPERWSSSYPSYEEIIYFHPFVRDLLYGDGSNSPESLLMRRLCQNHSKSVNRVEVQVGKKHFALEVKRAELYLCKPRLAILVVEVASTVGMSLWDTMTLQKAIRQTYPRYFDKGEVSDEFPRNVTWITQDSRGPNKKFSVPIGYRAATANFIYAGTEPPVVPWWHHFLAPLMPYTGPSMIEPSYQQIHDDSMPGMTYIAVDDPRTISEGDFDRLVFCDSPGDELEPYSSEFLSTLRPALRYDRYWNWSDTKDLGEMTFDTRFLCSGYQFVAIGRASSPYFSTQALGDFRTLYFRLALIAHYQRAALLKLADDAAEAIKLLQDMHPEQELSHKEFRRRITYLQMTFLKFRNRAWFSEVSNQIQGQEFFSLWRKELGLDNLYRHVEEGNQRTYAALAEYETRLLSRTAFRGLAITISLAGVGIVLTSFGDMKYTTMGIGAAIALVFTAIGFTEYFLTSHGDNGLLQQDQKDI